jgi:D-sedoheptulose 7-phosphate isomerase
MAKTNSWHQYIDDIGNGLRELVVTDRTGATMPSVEGYDRWVALTDATKQRDAQIFIIGNGGSAAMASHMAIDACKNGHLRALALNDAAMITAAGNDLSYDQIFRLPLERLGRKGDMLITISSSGNSPNVIQAVEAARAIGMNIVTLSAKKTDNQSRRLGDLNFYVPLDRYGWAESAHQIVMHCWFDQYLDRHRDGAM